MSISDLIVVMKSGKIQQIDKPQNVYDDPKNLFVAKFLGTPAINVFVGSVKHGRIFIGDDAVMQIKGVENTAIYVGIRPEGFIPDDNGGLKCLLKGVEVMGRDTSILSSHYAQEGELIRSIVESEEAFSITALDDMIDKIIDPVHSRSDKLNEVRFSVKPKKLFIFDRETEERIYYKTV